MMLAALSTRERMVCHHPHMRLTSKYHTEKMCFAFLTLIKKLFNPEYLNRIPKKIEDVQHSEVAKSLTEKANKLKESFERYEHYF